MTINPTAHADAILAWMESEIGTVSRDELRARIEQEVRDVARRAQDETLELALRELRRIGGPLWHVDTLVEVTRRISNLPNLKSK